MTARMHGVTQPPSPAAVSTTMTPDTGMTTMAAMARRSDHPDAYAHPTGHTPPPTIGMMTKPTLTCPFQQQQLMTVSTGTMIVLCFSTTIPWVLCVFLRA